MCTQAFARAGGGARMPLLASRRPGPNGGPKPSFQTIRARKACLCDRTLCARNQPSLDSLAVFASEDVGRFGLVSTTAGKDALMMARPAGDLNAAPAALRP